MNHSGIGGRGVRTSGYLTRGPVAAGLLVAAAMVTPVTARAQSFHRDGFEGRDPVWRPGPSDAPHQVAAHAITDQNAHAGQTSEHIRLTAEKGTRLHFVYPTPRAPLGGELNVSLWLRGNRPGAQLMARLVLPKERDPANLAAPLTTMLRGDVYQTTSRWQRLELRHPAKLGTGQQQLLRAQLGRDVDFADAYIDQLVLNLYSGPGLTEVWIDDLEVGPVEDRPAPVPAKTAGRPDRGDAPGGLTNLPGRAPLTSPAGAAGVGPGGPDRQPGRGSRGTVVRMNQDRLTVGDRKFLFLGIRYSDTPLSVLREIGLNTLWVDYGTPQSVLDDAANLGFWLVPALPVTRQESRLSSPEALGQELSRFRAGDAVLFWDLGDALVAEQAPAIERAKQVINAVDAQRPVTADVWDGFRPYSRGLDLMGVHRWPLMTSLELSGYHYWLNQRRLLARPGTFIWTWVQTQLPEWFLQMTYDHTDADGFTEPVGPQPEQIRLLTYLALAAGCRGIGYWSDRYLADTHQGRDRLLGIALLMQEMQMLEPLLSGGQAPNWEPTWIATAQPGVQAAVMRGEKGILVLPIWMGQGSQYVPGQAAAAGLTMTVPQVPPGDQAWLVSPGQVRSLVTQRVPGGVKVTVPEFGLTAAIVFTSDVGPDGLIVRFQDFCRRKRQQAAEWSYKLAQAELEKVSVTEAELEAAGHTLLDGADLLADTRRRLELSHQAWANGLYEECYLESQRALRPLRILMRAQWEKAMVGLDNPTSIPFAVSFYTLPRHWKFLDEIKTLAPGRNLLPEGGFEDPVNRLSLNWSLQESSSDNVKLTVTPSAVKPKEGKQSLLLSVVGKNPLAPPAALERTFLTMTSNPVKVAPGTIVRISGWIRSPGMVGSADGALLYDSIGGEPLAVRTTYQKEWRQFTLYRRVPASGTVSVTLAMTGLGAVFFDDVRIEPMVSKAEAYRFGAPSGIPSEVPSGGPSGGPAGTVGQGASPYRPVSNVTSRPDGNGR